MEHALNRVDRIAMKAVALVAVIGLFSRLIVLPMMAQAHAGSVAFCGGGKITWVAIGDEQYSDAPDTSDPCPYMGLPVAPASPPPQTSLPKAVWFQTPHLFGAAQQLNPAVILTARSRAPPHGF